MISKTCSRLLCWCSVLFYKWLCEVRSFRLSLDWSCSSDPGYTPGLRWTSGAAEWFCMPCCAERCRLTTTTCQHSSRRSATGSSSHLSTWTPPLLAFWNTCFRWTPWREPPSKRFGQKLYQALSFSFNNAITIRMWRVRFVKVEINVFSLSLLIAFHSQGWWVV